MTRAKISNSLNTPTPSILLTTLNAKYVHASLGLRYLYANMGELQAQTFLKEYSINARIEDIVENLLSYQPTIIGFGIYIWNINESLAVIRLLKQLLPDVTIVLGGPEVSYETESQPIVQMADYVLCGQSDQAFSILCEQIVSNTAPSVKIHQVQVSSLDELISPYSSYSDEDIKHRIIYVEASRGCPFKCEFCLSALDKTSTPFNLKSFLKELENLFVRGARQFKFVDRTFNLKIENSQQILNFFLDKLSQDEKLGNELFVHFEIIPDRLPEELKILIKQFPLGCLQFEIGIQSFNVEVQERISRKQNNHKTIENISWLRSYTKAHIHTDLIIGLPGEDWESFAQGFNQLVKLKSQDIQIGILKRLKGTPIIRYTEPYQLKFNQQAPYDILSTSCLSYRQIRELSRFSRYWEIIANSGNFVMTLDLLLAENAFKQFYKISIWIYQTTGDTHRFSQRRLYDLLFKAGQTLGFNVSELTEALYHDYQVAGLKGKPAFMHS